jgi:membrane-associated phospholipid phosphatase
MQTAFFVFVEQSATTAVIDAHWNCYKMIKKLLLPAALLIAESMYAQPYSSTSGMEKIYHVKVKYELPAAAAGLVLFSTVALPAVIRHASLTEAEVAHLDPANINWFDRPVALQHGINISKAIGTSDAILNGTLLAPALLMLDHNIRKDWLNTITLYMLTHAVNNTIFLAGVSSFRRVRPLAYNTELPMNERTGKGKTNSFYSGHVSNVTASSFFIVKIYTDHHHIKGWKRIMLYGAASVPPALVGLSRLRAGRHFRSDVITGFLIGGTNGIMVPELHRIARHSNLSMEPFYSPESMGLSVKLHLN